MSNVTVNVSHNGVVPSAWRDRALSAEAELDFINREYRDADPSGLTTDALMLKVRALEAELVSLRACASYGSTASRVVDEVRRLINSGYSGPFRGDAVAHLLHAVRDLEALGISHPAVGK